MAEQQEQPKTKGLVGEIEHGPSRADQFLEKQYKPVIVGVILLVVIGCATVIFWETRKDKENKASTRLHQAETSEDYQKLTADHGGTPAAKAAQLLLAETLWEEGKDKEALELLGKLETSTGSAPHAVQAKFAKALYLLKQGDGEEGKQLLEDISRNAKTQHLAPFAMLYLADEARKLGEEETARGYYESILNDFPQIGASFRNIVEERQSLIGLEQPVMVSPPESEDEEEEKPDTESSEENPNDESTDEE